MINLECEHKSMRRGIDIADESKRGSVELSSPIAWGSAIPKIAAAVENYLHHHPTKKGGGFNRAMHIQSWIASGRTEDPTFCFILLSAVFSIQDPNAGKIRNFFRLFSHSHSKDLAKMIADILIEGRYIHITCYRQEVHRYSSQDTLTSDSFGEASLRSSIKDSIGQSHGSEMESRAEYVKEEGVRYMLREKLSNMPEIQQKEYMKEIRALEALMIKPYVTTEPAVTLTPVVR